ncbi:hypothetical protein DE146DRAFT_457811 [Phaeosphaeria sp. MPI-PUGE-AT-0046c]|nr:hypothetical protein DE146DRAFT_457811 [Phaeosphaeria sp. MPI-PUGE-AT-0046c]
MSFSWSSRDISIHGPILTAVCCTSAGDWQQSELNLDRCLSNNDGQFRWQKTHFSVTAKNVHLQGSVLHALLMDRSGKYQSASVDLDDHIENDEGHLKYSFSHPKRGFSKTSRRIILHGTTLVAECKRHDDKWQESSLDLDLHLGFDADDPDTPVWGGSALSEHAEYLGIDGPVLWIRVRDHLENGEPFRTTVDLDEYIVNDNGRLKYRDWFKYMADTLDVGNGTLCEIRMHPPYISNRAKREQRDIETANAQDLRRRTLATTISSLSSYKHSPLPNKTAIRLLKIEPAMEDQDRIECSVIEVESTQSQPYVALSYTWGSPFPSDNSVVQQIYEQTTSITCNGQSFVINQNLYDALRRLRRRLVVRESECSRKESQIISIVKTGSLVEIEKALRQGVSVAVRDKSGLTPLHWAAKLGHLDIVKALVVAGSDLNAVCNDNKTALEYAQECYSDYGQAIESFLEDQESSKFSAHRAETSLRLDVTDTEYLWIDAICINQSDKEEKALQVAMMGEIYESAEHVAVWLGREFHDHHDTTEDLLNGVWRLELAREAGSMSEDALETLINDPVDTLTKSNTKARVAAIDWMNTLGIVFIEEWFLSLPIYQRTWFQRAWILQEVLKASKLTVVCGPYLVPWDMFTLMSCTIECCRLLLGQGNLSSAFGSSTDNRSTILSRGVLSLLNDPQHDEIPAVSLERWRRSYRCGHGLPMLSALSLSRNQITTDPRDKVFSVLSFSSIGQTALEGPQTITPDYTISSRHLYTQVAKRLIASHGPCVLSLSGMQSASSIEGLPSWVPNLDDSLHVRPRGINVKQLHNAPISRVSSRRGSMSHSFQSLEPRVTAQNELIVRAFVHDQITEVASSGLNNVGENLYGLKRWVEILSKLGLQPDQRRDTLLRTLSEHSSRSQPSINDANFIGWLKFVTFCSILGHQDEFRTHSRSFGQEPDIYYHEWTERPQSHIVALVDVAVELFAALGISLPVGTIVEWKDAETYSSEVGNLRYYYTEMIEEALSFGHILRDHDPSRRLLVTSTCTVLGTGPQDVQVGDVICAINGATVPYVLREMRDGKFQLVGEAFLCGVEDLEQMIDDAEARGKTRDICIV